MSTQFKPPCACLFIIQREKRWKKNVPKTTCSSVVVIGTRAFEVSCHILFYHHRKRNGCALLFLLALPVEDLTTGYREIDIDDEVTDDQAVSPEKL